MNFKYSFTPRRLPYVEFEDLYGAGCSIQLSSLAEKDAIWIGVDKADPRIMAKDANSLGLAHLLNEGPERLTGWVDYPVPNEVQFTTRMHLSQEQVKAILPILQYFANTGMFPTEEEVEAMR